GVLPGFLRSQSYLVFARKSSPGGRERPRSLPPSGRSAAEQALDVLLDLLQLGRAEVELLGGGVLVACEDRVGGLAEVPGRVEEEGGGGGVHEGLALRVRRDDHRPELADVGDRDLLAVGDGVVELARAEGGLGGDADGLAELRGDGGGGHFVLLLLGSGSFPASLCL